MSPFPAPYHPRPIRLGTVISDPKRPPYDLTEHMMAGHLAVLGGTGSGKSKFLELLMRRVLLSGRGLCFIDPHGDTAEDLLAYVGHRRGEKGDDALWRRVHYVEATYESVPKYDPFRFRPLRPIAPQSREAAYVAWLHTKVDRISEVLQRKQGQPDFEGMPRLQRVLRNVLYACGVHVEPDRHLPLADALVLLNVLHPGHRAVFTRVAPFLDSETMGDFEVLHGFKRDEDRRRETESTINRLRSFLSPLVKAMFTSDGSGATMDFARIVRNREILIVNLRETDYFSTDHKNAIGGLIVHEILTAVANLPRGERQPFSLVIDEAAELLGGDLQRALGAVRKYKLSICLAAQDLSSFRRGEFDMTPKVLSQCKTVVCFDQQYRDDKELMADRIFSGNLDYTERWEEVERDGGYDVIDVDEYGESFVEGESWGDSGSASRSTSRNWNQGGSSSSVENWNSGKSAQLVYRPDPATGMMVPDLRTTENEGRGGGQASASMDSEGGSEQEGTTKGWSHGRDVKRGRSVSHKKQFLHKTRTELRPTGSLERGPIDQQLKRFAGMFGQLPERVAAVKARGLPKGFLLYVDEVRDFFGSEDVKEAVLDWIRREVLAQHGYNVAPSLGHSTEEMRLLSYTGDGPPPELDEEDESLSDDESREENPYG